MSTPKQHCERNIIRRLRRIEKLLRRIDDKTSSAIPPSDEPDCVDAAGIAFITDCEGCELNPYYDSAGYLTVGVGHLLDGPDDPYNRTITQGESDMLLEGDLLETEECMDANVTVSVHQNEYNAMCSLAFNIGVYAFADSTLLRLLNEGEARTVVADQFLVWNKITVDGEKVVSEGLANRREKERALFLEEV
jgi:lysozyme